MQQPRTVVVVGHGMVGQQFVEKLLEYSAKNEDIKIVVFGEERHYAYDRLHLTTYFEHMQAGKMLLQELEWYEKRKEAVTVYAHERVVKIDSSNRAVITETGRKTFYDTLVLATGSVPFVPPIDGLCKDHMLGQFLLESAACASVPEEKDSHAHVGGVFVYRTLDDLDAILAYAEKYQPQSAAVIGGGLLGLEAMRVCSHHLKVKNVSVLDSSPHLMRRQLDGKAGRQLIRTIEGMGYSVLTNARTSSITSGDDGRICGLTVGDGRELEVDMVIIAAGIRPRDDLAATSETVEVHRQGGILVDDNLQTSDPNIFAIGECALHRGMCYGLVAPCYEMATVLAYNLATPEEPQNHKTFTSADLSTKLKLMGVDVASFGEYSLDETKDDPNTLSLSFEDPFEGVYRKLTFSKDGKKLLGGILVGDAADYSTLTMLMKSTAPLKIAPGSLVSPSSTKGSEGSGVSIVDMDDEAQVCSCNDVSKGAICEAVREGGCETMEQLVKCSKAGSSCGGCKPLVQTLLEDELSKLGKAVDKSLCEHFAYTRQEIFHIIQVNEIKSFAILFEKYGNKSNCNFRGCEICRPAVGSIFASLWNDLVVSPSNAPLQDTNDRFLGNIQRGGSYSIVPRIPGGEITPEKLIILGEIAKRYGLYTKITGGQRVDLFGAEKHQLPEIWEELVSAGFESGHAYGKALRTVKSCVGSTWCRYGMRDSVGFAIEVEERYRGIRSPHKLKGAVSGCIRECAEAQSKDFGLIATEKGYNLYVCGNGGSKPRHATLLASNLDEPTVILYLDRFLMFYIRTADRLQRTARWLENLEGGIDYLRKVVIEDSLGICSELEAQMANLVYTYKCEWAEVVNDPERRKEFVQFANQPKINERGIDFIEQRGQRRPADWPKQWESLPHVKTPIPHRSIQFEEEEKVPTRFPGAETWVEILHVDQILLDSGVVIRYGKSELALFKVEKVCGGFELYATQNMCPHHNDFVLASGLIGDSGGRAKVACPIDKKRYLLESGKCLDDERLNIWTFPTRLNRDSGMVSILLPSEKDLDEVLASEMFRVTAETSKQTPPQSTCSPCSDEKLSW